MRPLHDDPLYHAFLEEWDDYATAQQDPQPPSWIRPVVLISGIVLTVACLAAASAVTP